MHQFLKPIYILSFILSLLFYYPKAYAQQECATQISGTQINYINETFADRNTIQTADHIQGVIQIPVVAHIVGAEYGGISEEGINEAIQQLNDGFATVGFNFVRCLPQGDAPNLSETESIHFSISPQAGNEYALFADIAEERALNIFFTPEALDLNGNSVCGWASFPGEYQQTRKNWIVIRNDCSANGSTLIHEAGHFFNLYHTHQSKNISLGITGDELVREQGMPNETTHCGTGRGDELCDTPAEPYRAGNGILGIVNEACLILCDYQDINGTSYQIPTNETNYNFMSYAPATCRNHFTAGQIERMKISYLVDRNYIANYCPGEEPITANCDKNKETKVLFRLGVHMNAPYNNGNWPGVTFDGDCVKSINWNNVGLTGSIPPDIADFKFLESLDLSNNAICGIIPCSIGRLEYLQELDLSENNITGSIPAALGSLSNLQMLNLSGNKLCGYIPLELSDLSNLQELYVMQKLDEVTQQAYEFGCIHQNLINWAKPASNAPCRSKDYPKLCSQISVCTNCNEDDWYALKALYTRFAGSSPALQAHANIFGGSYNGNCNLELDFTALNEYGRVSGIWLGQKNLIGALPSEIGNLKDMETLVMDNNSINGLLPGNLKNLTKLKHLYLPNNQLSGSLPVSLTKLCGKTHMALFDNNFSNYYIAYDFCAGKGGYKEIVTDYVMPGDFNNDKKVDNIDLIYWRNAFGEEGIKRAEAHINWLPQFADNWSESTFGINKKHQDANGDGIINKADLEAYQLNLGKGTEGAGTSNSLNLSENGFELKLTGLGNNQFNVKIQSPTGGTQGAVDAVIFTVRIENTTYRNIQFDYFNAVPVAEEIQRIEGTDLVQIALAWNPNNPPPIDDPFGRLHIKIEDDPIEGNVFLRIDNIQILSNNAVMSSADINETLDTDTSADNCIENQVLQGSLNVTDIYNASNSIISPPQNAQGAYGETYINGCTNITFNAGRSITLNPGFKNQHGTVFCAQIQACTDSKLTNPFMEQSELSVFPNPANGQTTIAFDLAKASTVNLSITDMTGKQITNLINQVTKEKGIHNIPYNTSQLPTGVYYCTLKHNEIISTQKLIVVK